MRVLALISGGKDSCFNMMQCVASGHQIVALAHLRPRTLTELNSHMFQSVGFEAVEFIAHAMDLPLFQVDTSGISKETNMEYQETEGDEIEDLYNLIKHVKQNIDIDAVSSGAILSDYQRIRIENVCLRLGLVSIAYLWQRNQAELLQEMIKCEVDAILIKVAALGLDPYRHLGRSLRLIEAHLLAMQEKYGLNVCGEGGEYETLTLDCPLFKNRIRVDDYEIVLDSNDPVAPTGYLKLNKLSVELKLPLLELPKRLANLPLRNCDDYVRTFYSQPNDLQCSPEDQSPDYDKGDFEASLEIFDSNIFNQGEHASTSGDGWLFAGGITGTSSSSDPKEAFAKAIDKLKCSLTSNGHQLKDLCSITMYISDMSQYAELNKIYCSTVNHFNPPARACVQVPLPPSCPVIIQAISWNRATDYHSDNALQRSTIHVQSISHWCPANIGPYSQAVRIGRWFHVAGQIGLVPGSMKLIEGGIEAQCKLSLRHLERLLHAADSNCDLRNVVQAVCYISHQRYVECARKIWEEKTNNAIVDYVIVAELPRNALVEWHVWAHTNNHQFEYEETGQCIQDWSISIYRRWNYENNIAAIVCHVHNSLQNLENANTVLSASIFREAIEYVIQKLNQAHECDTNSICNLTIFYPVKKWVCACSFVSILEEFRNTVPLVHTIVPVRALNNKHTFLSICGVRTQ